MTLDDTYLGGPSAYHILGIHPVTASYLMRLYVLSIWEEVVMVRELDGNLENKPTFYLLQHKLLPFVCNMFLIF